ncbi:MAG: hypothetical protein H7232_16250 [Aeromicrobium sp.]|nr:hypothetical protein [Burkholderiales bacterium]
MPTVAVTVTEFSRSLSDFLSQVEYHGQVLDIARGKRVIARVSPVAVADGFPVDQLDALFANGPSLGRDRDGMAQDVKNTRAQLRGRSNPWRG